MSAAICWCGNADLAPFSPDYGECRVCGTLISFNGLPPEQLLVKDDEHDFYGKQYWLDHQAEDLNFPDIHARARGDLSERNLHWLKALLKYRLPPASVLELGCAHGSFVALLRQSGYDASGVEMSPWVVNFARETFGIPVEVGPVETLDLPAGNLDVIALMDVLEHLPDPEATMARCLELLKPDGLLLIQMPEFKESVSYAALTESRSPFLEQMKADEHLYLFSQRSARDLFRRLGAEHIVFEPAIFAHYDMFLVASRAPLAENTPESIEAALLATTNGRFALALLDLDERNKGLRRDIGELAIYKDNAIAQIDALTQWLNETQATLDQANAESTARSAQIDTLTQWLKDTQAETATYRENAEQQIQTLTQWVHEARAAHATAQEAHALLSRPMVRFALKLADIQERLTHKKPI